MREFVRRSLFYLCLSAFAGGQVFIYMRASLHIGVGAGLCLWCVRGWDFVEVVCLIYL